jgi:hypothetical protein
MAKKQIIDKQGKKRIINDSSLNNLKLGPKSRDQGKQRTTLTLLPETIQWLGEGGNISGKIDEIVNKIKSGELVESNQVELKQNQIDLKIIEKVIALLESALPLKANSGGAIKNKIKETLAVLKSNL